MNIACCSILAEGRDTGVELDVAQDQQMNGEQERRRSRRTAAGYRGKRAVDLLLTIPALIVLAPVFVIVALVIRIRLGAPILFRQVRPGLDGTPFTIYKFRTMRDIRDERGQPLPDVERLTALGRFLRATSLDELPELLNVLKGDMSLVGPRPLLMDYLERYSREQARRHDTRPGITGWSQAHGRNALSWEERFRLDVWYVDHQSLWLDIRIILLTIVKIVTREGINQPGRATADPFEGSLLDTSLTDRACDLERA
jgi:sugar transferase EpsL